MKSSQERLELANRSFILVAFLTGVLSIIIGLGLYWFLEILFGEDYLDALSVFYWLVPGIIAKTWEQPIIKTFLKLTSLTCL